MRLISPHQTKQILAKYNFKSSKVLGQNFLVDANILDKIVRAAELKFDDVVLEIGPGIGSLTECLAEKTKLVIAIEYDRVLVSILMETLGHPAKIKLICADALKLDLNSLKDLPPPNKMVSNLPYSIAAPLLGRYLENYPQVKSYLVMVQKEIAARMAARPGEKDYGRFTLRVQYHSKVKIVSNVSRKVFIPQPNVDSSIVLLERRLRPVVEVVDTTLLFQTIAAAFNQRRKTLRSALKSLPYGQDKIEKAFQKAGIDSNRRGETLSLSEFGRLSDAISEVLG